MLRKDIRFVLRQDWEPKVPETAVIQDQVSMNNGKIAGSVRFSQGLVIGEVKDADDLDVERDLVQAKKK